MAVYQVLEGLVYGGEALAVGVLVDGGLDKACLQHFYRGGHGVEGDDEGTFFFGKLHDGPAGAVDTGGQDADGVDFWVLCQKLLGLFKGADIVIVVLQSGGEVKARDFFHAGLEALQPQPVALHFAAAQDQGDVGILPQQGFHEGAGGDAAVV